MYFIYDLLLLIALIAGIISLATTIISLIAAKWKTFVIFLIPLIISIATWITISNTDEQRAMDNNILFKSYGVVTSISENSIYVDGDYKVTLYEKVKKIHKIDFVNLDIGDVVEMEFLKGVMENYLIKIEKIK
ncbi:hypothetical protein ACFQZE_06445 [Paenibacillus sp. GCM10027627]|uniref:hypothetical protein n=1 Tax=unclassified Paenibacillus TaxID=185978 RepID=UPI003644CF8E